MAFIREWKTNFKADWLCFLAWNLIREQWLLKWKAIKCRDQWGDKCRVLWRVKIERSWCFCVVAWWKGPQMSLALDFWGQIQTSPHSASVCATQEPRTGPEVGNSKTRIPYLHFRYKRRVRIRNASTLNSQIKKHVFLNGSRSSINFTFTLDLFDH